MEDPAGAARPISFDRGVVVLDAATGRFDYLGLSAPRRPEVPPAPLPPAPAGLTAGTAAAAGLAGRYRPALREVAVEHRVPGLDAWFAALAAPCAVAEPAGPPAATLRLERVGDGFALGRDGACVEVSDHPVAAHALLLQALWRASCPEQAWPVILHGSACAGPRGAVALVGRTTAGKSTLNLALVAAGFRFVSDDLLPLDALRGEVRAVPLAAGVKPGSWPLVTALLPELARQDPAPVRRVQARYVEVPEARRCAAGEAVPLYRVLFPRWEQEAPLELLPLSPVELVTRLGETGSTMPRTEPELRAFLAWAERTPAFALRYGETAPAIELVRLLCG